MPPRLNDPIAAQRPTPFWFAGIMIGLTISTLATSAMVLGTGLALSKTVTGSK